ncbi:SDR family NAD(P)-dependent oxidoreductase [Phenylobacterium sp.]|uniref:SDR family NAD(P)-dependent oxidoreductase n=1 Tax=Phenylobacterium sp. TaxID=1871053 RepID=UPI00289BAC0C|nr:SDR family NAD(P)-dependent oxidoreductase [Phenylobacterium sp.]
MGVLEGKTVLVTGAAGGIGRECALAAAREGANVVVNDLGASMRGDDPGSASAAELTAQDIRTSGGRAVANSDSVSNYAAAQGMVELALTTFGGLDAVINPAGILRDGMFHKMAPADWDAVIDVHLRGAFNVSRAAVEHFRNQGGGSFVHFTSTSGLIGNIGQANYAAAKMGVAGLSRLLAMEGAAKGVRSNAIAPFAWTRMIASIPVTDEASARRVERMRAGMRADQVAQLAVALASDKTSDVNGQLFVVRGDEVVLFSQPRPVASVSRVGGWTPDSLISSGLPALRHQFLDLSASPDVFSYDPI